MATTHEELKEIGKNAFASIKEMVAALECDYDRLEELRELWLDANQTIGEDFTQDDADELKELEASAGDCSSEDDARQRIEEDPLSIEYRSGWSTSKDELEAEEVRILLTTGGPAVQIIGELDSGEVSRATLHVQDWGTSWTAYYEDGIGDVLLKYCSVFCFE